MYSWNPERTFVSPNLDTKRWLVVPPIWLPVAHHPRDAREWPTCAQQDLSEFIFRKGCSNLCNLLTEGPQQCLRSRGFGFQSYCPHLTCSHRESSPTRSPGHPPRPYTGMGIKTGRRQKSVTSRELWCSCLCDRHRTYLETLCHRKELGSCLSPPNCCRWDPSAAGVGNPRLTRAVLRAQPSKRGNLHPEQASHKGYTQVKYSIVLTTYIIPPAQTHCWPTGFFCLFPTAFSFFL